MTKPRTLRCPRHLGLILAGAAIAALFGVVATDKALDGAGAPALAAGIVLFLLALAALPKLRTRMIMDDAGLTLVSGYRRSHFDWAEIVEISADAYHSYFLLQVRSEDREHQAVFFPVRLASMKVDQGTHLQEPSADTPYGLYKLHAELWEEWQSRVSAPA
ncbi:PH domain-containing protein [Spirillospora sp. CA-142024]|uniref:PH domain-containing protein n=1 Tax=Spirillospora sp. CA-142024 TaxID=3240036 RepID=UPI003D937436